MYVIVPIENGDLAIGTVLRYDSTSKKWNTAADIAGPIGVLNEIRGDAVEGWFGHVIFAGTTMALCSRDIPDSGGWIDVENGKVFVNSTASEHSGIVSPTPQGQSQRLANELVMVHIR